MKTHYFIIINFNHLNSFTFYNHLLFVFTVFIVLTFYYTIYFTVQHHRIPLYRYGAIEMNKRLDLSPEMPQEAEKSLLQSHQEAASIDEKVNEFRVFIELTSYIEKAVDSQTLLFKLSDMHSLYVNRLEDLGIKKLNKTRLKEQLLERFPEVQEQYDGRNTVIIFKEGMINMLKEAL